MALVLACTRPPAAQLLVSVHPIRAFRYDAEGNKVGPPRDRGVLLVGAEVDALLEGLELSWEDDSLVHPDHAPTHEVRLQQRDKRVLYEVHPTAFEEGELAQRLGMLLAQPPTHYGHWVAVPADMPPERALAALGRPGFLQPLRKWSPWVEVTWETHTTEEVAAVEQRLCVRREAFTAHLLQEIPGTTDLQGSSGSEGASVSRVYASQRYQLPFGVDPARVVALAEAAGAQLEEGHAPTHYLVSVWTEQPEPPSLPAPFQVIGPYFPFPG